MMIDDFSPWMLMVLAINMAVAVSAIVAFRFLMGLLAGISTTKALAEQDNYAFCTVFSGGAIGLGLILSASVEGEAAASLWMEAVNIVTYVVAGILMLKVGAQINEWVIFHRVSLKKAILSHNVAIGIVQAANFIALGIIINAIVGWLDTENWTGLLAALMAFFATQTVLLGVTRIRAFIYAKRHPGECLQDALLDGNRALAIRYAGHILGTALTFSAAGDFVSYIHDAPFLSALSWAVVSACLSLCLTAFAFVSRIVILYGVNVVEEVDQQRNTGVASVEAAIFIVIGLLLTHVMV